MKSPASHIDLPQASDSDPSPVSALGGPQPEAGDSRIRLLVSACLLGEEVRYDKGHKRDPYLVEDLGRFVEWVRVCPESDSGMPRASRGSGGPPSTERWRSESKTRMHRES